MTMTRFIRVGIAAAAAVTALTVTAQAADMRPVYKAPPPVAVYSWTGCYIGGQVGGQWARWTGAVNYPAGDPLGHPAVNASRGSQTTTAKAGCSQVGSAFEVRLIRVQ